MAKKTKESEIRKKLRVHRQTLTDQNQTTKSYGVFDRLMWDDRNKLRIWIEEPFLHLEAPEPIDPDALSRSEIVEAIAGKIIKNLPTLLTPRQYEIFKMHMLENRTQRDVANILGLTQGHISLTLYGVPKKHQPRASKTKTEGVWGGIIPKLRKWAEQDEEIMTWMAQLPNAQ